MVVVKEKNWRSNMKKLIIGLTLLSSISSFASTYNCSNSDSESVVLEASSSTKTKTFANGEQIFLTDTGEVTTLMVLKDRESLSAQGVSGSISVDAVSEERSINVVCAKL